MNELRFKLKDIDRVVLYGGREGKRAAEVFAELQPDYLINGGMYSMSGKYKGLTVCDTIVGGLINGGNYTDKGLAWDDNDIAPETTAKAKQRGYAYFLGGSPSLVWDGAVNIDSKGFAPAFLKVSQSIRIGMGLNDNELIFCFPDEKMKMTDFAETMLAAGCEYAINLDGGGSTSVFENQNGKMVALNDRTEDRANSTWLAIYLTKKDGDKMKKVVLDAGHGGADPGALGRTAKEKDVVLQITLKTGEVLKRHGVDVVYTRDKDLASTKKLILSERVNIANKAKADLFVSIHANAASNLSAGGQETYAYKMGTVAYSLAHSIQKEIVAVSGLKDRGVKINDYYVLVHTTMPAALVETAFISNSAEEALLKNDEWQEKMAVAIAKGILSHLGIAYKAEPAKTENTKPDTLYPDAVTWAKEMKISDGSNPKNPATREQVIEMLYRFSKTLK